jgi:hypothetical protein
MALVLLIAQARSVEAAVLQWSLTFFNQQGDQVGSGEFSYDTDLVAVVKTPDPYSDAYIAGKDEPLRPDFIPPIPGFWDVTRYPNPLVSFTAELPSQTWQITQTSWFNNVGPGSLLGSFGCTRTDCRVASQWFAGSIAGFAPGQFVMFGGAGGGDRFTGSFLSAPIPAPPGVFTSGTWVAEAVPEPATVVGTLLVSAGYLASRKRRA